MPRRCAQCASQWPDEMSFCPRDGAALEQLQSIDSVQAAARTAGRPLKVPQVGDRLGPYQLSKLLAVGGMGHIYQATHTALGREVAVKVLSPELCEDQEVIARFFREARAVNLIQHRNIVTVTDFVPTSEFPAYMVMELLIGRTLSEEIKSSAPMGLKATCDIALQVCAALMYMHEAGIVHRDLKPDNIFLCGVENPEKKPLVKLLDFGLAKHLSEDTFHITRTGQRLGTAEYMAPEQIMGRNIDQRTDVYAMGVIIYEMLCGKLPFAASSLEEQVFATINDNPKPVSVVRQHPDPLPGAVDDLLLQCLTKDPDDRIESMEELADLLRWASAAGKTELIDVPAHLARKPEAPRRSAERAAVKARPRGLVVAASISALIAVIVVAWAIIAGRGGSEGEARTRSRSPMGGATTANVSMKAKVPAASSPKRRLVVSVPDGAMVYRVSDGKFMGKSPLWVSVTSGAASRYLVRHRGYREARVSIDAKTAGPVRVTLDKPPEPMPVAAMPPPMRAPRVRPRVRPRWRPRPRVMYRRPPMSMDIDQTVNPFGMK